SGLFACGLVTCLYTFFFQAEDGIRDFHVTGVQTCALPIYELLAIGQRFGACPGFLRLARADPGAALCLRAELRGGVRLAGQESRSEERRVGKERKSR